MKKDTDPIDTSRDEETTECHEWLMQIHKINHQLQDERMIC